MPNLNHKGPKNEGPRTGRGMGRCAQPNSEKQQFDRFGCGMNQQKRFRCRNWFNQFQND